MSCIVTTSWDDGHALDLRLAELLKKYGLKGTFYISKEYCGKDRLTEEGIRSLGVHHEVGAHTITHPDLTRIPKEEALREMQGSKAWLESIIGKPVDMFCYPYGRYDEGSKHIAEQVGYKGARTTKAGEIFFPADRFAMGTTLQIYPLPFRKKSAGSFHWRYLLQPWLQRASELHKLGVPYKAMVSWEKAARGAFDIALRRGGVFHLWGHSWEIEKYGMWAELEDLFRYIHSHPNSAYLTNGEVITYRESHKST